MAKISGVTMISRAKGKHFLVLNGVENIQFDSEYVALAAATSKG
jgi:hypothetical protein